MGRAVSMCAVQKISSAATCVKKLPKAFTELNKVLRFPQSYWAGVRDVLDYGGGKYDLLSDTLAEFKVRTFVYDPFNRSDEHNQLVLKLLKVSPADMSFCNCVLNVVREKAARYEILKSISRLTERGGYAVFSVYEGDRSGRGKKTTKGWQNNRRLKSYVPEIRKFFDVQKVTRHIVLAYSRHNDS